MKKRQPYFLLSKRQAVLWALIAVFLIGAFFVALHAGAKAVQTAANVGRKLPIYSVECSEKKVALGFNAAWDDKDIDELIRILEEKGVKATFFVVGEWAQTYPEAVKKLFAAGHEIMNHSMTHADFTKLSQQEIVQEVTQADDVIESLTGVRPTLFRMPSGAYNNLAVETVESLGHQVIQWDADSIDWKNPSVDTLITRMRKRCKAGSITLFHAGAENTPKALGAILDQLKADGFTIVRVSELVYTDHYRIDANGRQWPEDTKKE